jgi:raffinose/stachyose/melibiose transport system substrate-binding protein
MHRRTLIKRTGAVAGAAAFGPAILGARPAFAQDAGTLEFWDTYNADPRKTIFEDLGKQFASEHEGLKVEHRGWTLEELQDTLPRVVESNQGPDVAQINNGESLMGPMIRAGQLWGVSAEAEIVGIYYNRSILEDAGVELPTTLSGLEEAFQALKDADQTPLAFGNTDKWSAIHLFGEIQGTMTTREYLDGIIYRTGEQSFEDQSIIDAAAKLQDWVSKGYLLDGFEGISSDDAAAIFQSGGAAMLVQGSWQAGSVGSDLGEDKAGFFLIPPQEEGGTVLNVGGVGIPFGITTNADDPDLAAGLINTFVSNDAFDALIAAGLLPSGDIPEDAITPDTVSGDLYTAWNSALADDALGHYLDWAAPGFYDVLTSELQKLLGQQVTPEEFAKNLQDFYAKSFD